MTKNQNYYDMVELSHKEVRKQGIILRILLVLCLIGVSLNIWRSYKIDHRLIPLENRIEACHAKR